MADSILRKEWRRRRIGSTRLVNYYDGCKLLLLSSFCDPGRYYISWLCVVSLTFLYNAWVIPLRSSFPFQTEDNTNTWLTMDFCGDVIYLIDVVLMKHRVMYLYEGFWVRNKNLTRKNYMRKLQFKVKITVFCNEIFFIIIILRISDGYSGSGTVGLAISSVRNEGCLSASSTTAKNSKLLGIL